MSAETILIDNLPIGYYRTTRQGIIVKANLALARMLGCATIEELAGQSLDAFGSSLEYSRSVFLQMLEQNGRLEGLSTIWVRSDGATLYARESAWLVKGDPDAGDDGFHIKGLVEDVTEQVRLKEFADQNQIRWGAILESALDAVITVNADQKIVYMNRSAEETFGWPINDIIGKPLDSLIPDRFRPSHRNHIQNFQESQKEGGRMAEATLVWARRADGSEFPIEASLSRVSVSGHSYYTAFVRDITKRVQVQKDLTLAAKVIENSSEGVIITDASARIIAINDAFTKITGYTEEETLGQNPSLLKSGRHTDAFYENMWTTLRGRGFWRGEIWNRRKDGEVYPEWLTISAIKNDEGEVTNYMAIFIDITARVQNEALLRYLATHDPLTNLPNRDLFRDRLRRALVRAQRHKTQVGVLLLDLDDFKAINDTYGHAFGDLVLQEVAERLTNSFRESDTVARLGGDEFTVILEDISAVVDVQTVIRKLLSITETPIHLNGHSAAVGLSIGVSMYPEDGLDPEILLNKADAAMYRAKESGKNAFRFSKGLRIQPG